MKKVFLKALCIVYIFDSYFLELKAQILVGSLTNGIAGQWELNGNGADSSAAMNSLTFAGTQFVQDRFGEASSALKIIETQGDWGAAISQKKINIIGNADRTISFWCKFSAMGYRPSPYTQVGVSWGKKYGETGVWNQHSGLSQESTGYIFFWGDWADVASQDTISEGYDSWRMVTMSYNGSLGLEASAIFVNGIQTPLDLPREGPQSNSLDTVTSEFRINGMSGDYIDSIVVWDRALSTSEVSELYRIQSVPEPSSLSLLLAGGAVLMVGRRRKSD